MLNNEVRNIILIVLLVLLMYFCLQMVSETTIQEGFNFRKWVNRQAAIAKRKTLNSIKTIGRANIGGNIVNTFKKIRIPPPPRVTPKPKFNGLGKLLEHMNTLPFYSGVAATQSAALISAGVVNITDTTEKNIDKKKAELQTASDEISKYIGSWKDYVALQTDNTLGTFFRGSYKIVIGNLKIMQDSFQINTKDKTQVRDFIRILNKYGLSLDQAKTVMSSYNLKSIKELDVISSKIKLSGLQNTKLISFLESSTKKFQVPLNSENGYEEMSYFIKILKYYGITTYANYVDFANAFLSAMSINYMDLVTMYNINIHYGVVVPNVSKFMNDVFSMRGSCDTECRETKGKYDLTSPFLVQYEKTICKLRSFGITDTGIYLDAMSLIPLLPFSNTTSKNAEKECYINTFKQYGIDKIEQIVMGGNRLHSSFPATSSTVLEVKDYTSFGMKSTDNLFDFINKLNEIKVSVKSFNLYKERITNMFSVKYKNYNEFHSLLLRIQYYWTNREDFDVFTKDVNAFNNGTNNQGIAKLTFFVNEISNFGIPTYIEYRNFVDFMKANVNITNVNLKQLIDTLKKFGITKSSEAIELIIALKRPSLKLNLNKSKPFSSFLERLMALGVNASNIATANIGDLITNDGTTFNKSLSINPDLTPRRPSAVSSTVQIRSIVPMNQVDKSTMAQPTTGGSATGTETFVGMDFNIYSLLGSLVGTKIEREGINSMGSLERLKQYGAVSIDNICLDKQGEPIGWEKFSAKMEEFGIPSSSRAIDRIIMVLEIFKTDFGITLATFFTALDISIKFGLNVNNLKKFAADIRANLINGSMVGDDYILLVGSWINFDVRYSKYDKYGDYVSLLTAGKQFGWNRTYVSSRTTYYGVMEVLKDYGITHRNHLNDTRFTIFVYNMTGILKMTIVQFNIIRDLLEKLRLLDDTTNDIDEIKSASHNMRDVITPMPNMTYKLNQNGNSCVVDNTCDGSEEKMLIYLMLNSTNDIFAVGLLVPYLLQEEYQFFKKGDINGLLNLFIKKYNTDESGAVYQFVTNLSTAFYKKIETERINQYPNYEKYMNTYNILRFFPYTTFSVLAGALHLNDDYDDLMDPNIQYNSNTTNPGNTDNQTESPVISTFTTMNNRNQNYRTDVGYGTMLNMSSSLWKSYTTYNP